MKRILLFVLIFCFLTFNVAFSAPYIYHNGQITKIYPDDNTAYLINFNNGLLNEKLELEPGESVGVPEGVSGKSYIWNNIESMMPLSVIFEPTETDKPVYGILINRKTGSCERILDSKNLKNDYVIGDEFALNNGINDFDNCYPWRDIKLCNVTQTGNVCYFDDPAFKRDGTNGDVMVEIPKFYSIRRVDGDYEFIAISEQKYPGFETEPMFIDNYGNEKDKIYIGAYAAYNGKSRTGDLPTAGKTVQVNQETARKYNADLYSVDCWSAIQKLVSIEFGAINISPYLNGIGGLIYRGGVFPSENKTNATSAIFEGEESTGICDIEVGDWIVVSNKTMYNDRQITSVKFIGYDEQRKKYQYEIGFSGEAISLFKGQTFLYSTAQPNGLTDGISYHTGRIKRENDKGNAEMCAQFKYRNMEGLWGNIWTQLGGIKIKNLTYYYANNSDYYCSAIDENWQKLSYVPPIQNSPPSSDKIWIVNMGLDYAIPSLGLPVIVGKTNGGGSDEFYGDGFYSYYDKNQNGKKLDINAEWYAISGGGWDHLDRNGPYAIRFWTDNGNSWLYGSRIIRY